MLLNNILPHPSLRAFVRLYRIIHFDFTHSRDYVQATKAYRPRIEHCLQFTPFDPEVVAYPHHNITPIVKKTVLFGQHTVLNNRCVGRHYLNFQVVFQPGILCRLLRMPVSAITNLYADATDYLGTAVTLVNEQLFHAGTYEEMIAVVESYLQTIMKRLQKHAHPVDTIGALMLQHSQQHTIEWYASQANLCLRQFDRLYKDRMGITPKEYSSLVRLDHAYLLKNRFPQQDWLTIALNSGFYDYQHLSREYKKFTGFSPTAYFALEQQAPERYFGDFEK